MILTFCLQDSNKCEDFIFSKGQGIIHEGPSN